MGTRVDCRECGRGVLSLGCYSTTGRKPLYTYLSSQVKYPKSPLPGLVDGKISVLDLGFADECMTRQSPGGKKATEIKGEIEEMKTEQRRGQGRVHHRAWSRTSIVNSERGRYDR